MNVTPATIAPPLRVSSRAIGTAAGAAVLAGLVWLRVRALHPGLLYPDGYQYLLMARGIGQHLQPVASLGHGGDTLAPSADAAVKPLFPALVALGQAFGLSPIDAARVVTATAGAAVAPLAGLLTLRLGAARAGALLAAALCLASPSLGFWLGFPGPEALAEALALGTAVAAVARRPILAGALGGLAVTARPELLAVALAVAIAAAASARLRRDAVLAAAAGLTIFALVFGILRPPLSSQTLVLFPAVVALGCVAAAGLVLASRATPRRLGAAAVVLAGLLAFALARGSGWTALAHRDWALLSVAGAGLALGARRRETRVHVLRLAVLVLALALAYWWKNPGSERYASILLPALAVLAGLGLGRLRPAALAAAAALSVAGALVVGTPSVAADSFQAVASHLGRSPAGPLVTAAPDAYGVLLPDRAVRVLRSGARGLVLVDGAARAYEPDLRVAGRLLERIGPGAGFLRLDGTLDDAPALLYRGVVRERASASSTLPSARSIFSTRTSIGSPRR